MDHKAEILASLKRTLATYELGEHAELVPLGCPDADKALRDGLRPGVLHEVYPQNGSVAAAATGFATGLALRLSGKKPICWIAMDFASIEHGALSASGLLELGLDPSRIVYLRLAKGEDALRAAADVLACGSIGSVVLEVHGRVKAMDLKASRKLQLAAQAHGVSLILLRLGMLPEASTAETRWLIHPAKSPPITGEEDWGLPAFDVQLIRNRHGEVGHWRMGWDCDVGFFREHVSEPSPHHGDVVPASAYGSPASKIAERRTG